MSGAEPNNFSVDYAVSAVEQVNESVDFSAEEIPDLEASLDLPSEDRAQITRCLEYAHQCYPELSDYPPESCALVLEELVAYEDPEAGVFINDSEYFPPEDVQFLIEDLCKGFEKERQNTEVIEENTEVIEENTEVIEENAEVIEGNTEFIEENTEIEEENDQKIVSRQLLDSLWQQVDSEGFTGLEAFTEMEKRLTSGEFGYEIDQNLDAESVKNSTLELLGSYRARLQSLSQLVEDPYERSAVEDIVGSSSIDFTGGSDAEVFADVIARLDASVELTEESKDRLKESLGVKVPDQVTNATELKSTLKNIKDNDGVVGYYSDGSPRMLSEKTPLQINENVTVFPTEKGTYMVEAQTGDYPLKIEFSDSISEQELNTRVNVLLITAAYAQAGFNNIANAAFSENYFEGQGETTIDASEIGDYTRGEYLAQAMLGEWQGMSAGEFLSPGDLNVVAWRLQALYKKGDGDIGDNNSEIARQSTEELGITSGDSINWGRLDEAGDYIRRASALPTHESVKEALKIPDPVIEQVRSDLEFDVWPQEMEVAAEREAQKTQKPQLIIGEESTYFVNGVEGGGSEKEQFMLSKNFDQKVSIYDEQDMRNNFEAASLDLAY